MTNSRKICHQQFDLATIISQRWLWRFGLTIRRPHHTFFNKALRCIFLPGWKKQHGGHKKTWFTNLKADLDPIGSLKKYGRRWEKSWLKLIEPLANDQDSWLTTMTKILDARESWDAWVLLQVQVSTPIIPALCISHKKIEREISLNRNPISAICVNVFSILRDKLSQRVPLTVGNVALWVWQEICGSGYNTKGKGMFY